MVSQHWSHLWQVCVCVYVPSCAKCPRLSVSRLPPGHVNVTWGRTKTHSDVYVQCLNVHIQDFKTRFSLSDCLLLSPYFPAASCFKHGRLWFTTNSWSWFIDVRNILTDVNEWYLLPLTHIQSLAADTSVVLKPVSPPTCRKYTQQRQQSMFNLVCRQFKSWN